MLVKRIEHLGAGTLNVVEEAGRTFNLLLLVLWQMLQAPYRMYPIIRQTYFIGARSLTIIALAGLTIGMVIGLAFYTILVRFASVNLLGAGVVLSIVREIGPIMTALMVIGRAGSAMTAELGIMRISEQVDALECMAIDPDKYLVLPRVIAGLLSVPLLTHIFDFVAIYGGYFVGVIMFGMSEGMYMNSMMDVLEWEDVRLGLIKSVIFGVLITLICCAKGYYIHFSRYGSQGAEGVSQATTDAVVLASISVLFADFIIGALMS